MPPNGPTAVSKGAASVRRLTGAVLLSSVGFLAALSIQQVFAATYVGPSTTAPGGNVPVTIWNRLGSTGTQTNAAIAIDGGGSPMGAFVGLSVGAATTDLGLGAAGQNLFYGIADYTKINAGDRLLLLQTQNGATATDRLALDRDGSLTVSGTLTAANVETAGRLHGSGCVGHTFVGLTPTAYTPTGIAGAGGGYGLVNGYCNSAYAGSHVCRSEEILESFSCSVAGDPIRNTVIVPDGTPAYVNGGPPGYKALANDCDGWTSVLISAFGRIWYFNSVSGGKGSQTHCNVATGIKFACCK